MSSNRLLHTAALTLRVPGFNYHPIWPSQGWTTLYAQKTEHRWCSFCDSASPWDTGGHWLTPLSVNHTSAKNHLTDMAACVPHNLENELCSGPLTTLLSSHGINQTNHLLTRPKKDSSNCHVTMDLSWPYPRGHSVKIIRASHYDKTSLT